MTENVYEKGDRVRLSAAFDNGAVPPVPTDPTDVFFRMVIPHNPTPIVYHYGVDIELVKDSTGNYHVDYIPTVSGEYQDQFQGVGNVDRTVTDYWSVKYTDF